MAEEKEIINMLSLKYRILLTLYYGSKTEQEIIKELWPIQVQAVTDTLRLLREFDMIRVVENKYVITSIGVEFLKDVFQIIAMYGIDKGLIREVTIYTLPSIRIEDDNGVSMIIKAYPEVEGLKPTIIRVYIGDEHDLKKIAEQINNAISELEQTDNE